jgi:PAS domain S-box-containing protein
MSPGARRDYDDPVAGVTAAAPRENTMIGKHPTASPAGPAAGDGALASHDAYGTLVIDRHGRIRSCGLTVERIFGLSQARMIGRQIADFVAGFTRSDSSPSYGARYFAYLTADDQWRRFAASEADGCRISVDIKLTRLLGDGEEVFLLNVHRPEAPAGR